MPKKPVSKKTGKRVKLRITRRRKKKKPKNPGNIRRRA